MALYLKSKNFDLGAGKDLFVIVHQKDADELGITEGEIVLLGLRMLNFT